MNMKANIPERLNLESMSISKNNKEKLKSLFPSIFTETINENGEFVQNIDFEKLKAELGSFSDTYESRREHYGMDWPGKKDCMKLIQEPSLATLKPCMEESVNFDETKNLFIEGDNLEVLKLLQKSYYGKIKMIYIDPPYNTGKEFIYPDKYSESLDTYLAYAGLVDDEGKKFSTNTPNEGRFHTKWLNMMYPRLYLARNLLKDDGVIFISIDDNEMKNLRELCDEIFGEENFVVDIIWHKKYAASNDAKGIPPMHDNILVYQKSGLFNRFLLPRTEKQDSLYKYDDNDGREKWRPDNLTVKTVSESYIFEIENPDTGVKFLPAKGRCWLTNKETIDKWIEEGRVFFGKEGRGAPQLKRYLKEVQQGIVPTSYWSYQEVGHTDNARKELKRLFQGNAPFDNPKPTGLLKRVLQISSKDEDIILDFFSGSCTTAHAVLDLNNEDNSNLNFIMVQLPEPCDEKSEAYKSGFKTIADIGKERIRRVIRKIETEQETTTDQLSLPSAEEKDQKNLDLGFKVFKLNKSNFKVWDQLSSDISEEELLNAIQKHLFNMDEDASQEDILYEILLKSGLMLSDKVERLTLANKTVFSIAEGSLLVCLEDDISHQLIEAVAEFKPKQFICLDRGFHGNDQLKANAMQTFSAINQDRDKTDRIIFRTV